MAEHNTKETLLEEEATKLEEELKEQKMKSTILGRIKGFYNKHEVLINTVGLGALTGLVSGASAVIGAKLTYNAINDHKQMKLVEVELEGEEIIIEDGESITRMVEGQ